MNETEESLENQVATEIESRVAVEIKLETSTSVKADVYSININGDIATFNGKYSELGDAYGTVSGTFKGTCTVEMFNDKVITSNEDIEIN